MVDKRLPQIPGVSDYTSYLRFLDDREAFDAYHAQLEGKILQFVEAAGGLEALEDADRMRSDAEAVLAAAEDRFSTREAAVQSAEVAVEAKRREHDEVMAREKRERDEANQETSQLIGRREDAVGRRDHEITQREEAVLAREEAAERKLAEAEAKLAEANAKFEKLEKALA